jgi:hypothetical protein
MRQAAQRVAAIARRVLRESDDFERVLGRPPLLSPEERARFEADIARLLGHEPLPSAQDFDGA